MRRARLHPVSHSKTLPSPSGKVGEGREELSVEAERERQEGLGAQAKEGLLAGTWNRHGHGLSKTILHVPFAILLRSGGPSVLDILQYRQLETLGTVNVTNWPP